MKKFTVQTAVIGAGMSGIAAATNFLDHNYENFLIFEANDKIGGRCRTINYGKKVSKN